MTTRYKKNIRLHSYYGYAPGSLERTEYWTVEAKISKGLWHKRLLKVGLRSREAALSTADTFFDLAVKMRELKSS